MYYTGALANYFFTVLFYNAACLRLAMHFDVYFYSGFTSRHSAVGYCTLLDSLSTFHM